MKKLNTPKIISKFETEVRVLQQISHQNIVNLVDVLRDDFNYYVIMEFCSGGDLLSLITSKKKISEHETKRYMYQIMMGLQYLHGISITHRDLKPDNIFLDKNGAIKIGDFGFSRYIPQDNLATTICGSPCYSAPECFSGNPYNPYKSDIWSCGIIMYAMLTGHLPWKSSNRKDLYKEMRFPIFSIPISLSTGCSEFLLSLLKSNPSDRPSVDVVLSHYWFNDSPKSMNRLNGTKCSVSLRQIDVFFGLDKLENDLEAQPLRRTNSSIDVDMFSTEKKIKCQRNAQIIEPSTPPKPKPFQSWKKRILVKKIVTPVRK